MLPDKAYNESISKIREADMLMVLGTSLVVYPAAGLIELFNGKYLVIINKDKTQYDDVASLVIHDNLSKVFSELNES